MATRSTTPNHRERDTRSHSAATDTAIVANHDQEVARYDTPRAIKIPIGESVLTIRLHVDITTAILSFPWRLHRRLHWRLRRGRRGDWRWARGLAHHHLNQTDRLLDGATRQERDVHVNGITVRWDATYMADGAAAILRADLPVGSPGVHDDTVGRGEPHGCQRGPALSPRRHLDTHPHPLAGHEPLRLRHDDIHVVRSNDTRRVAAGDRRDLAAINVRRQRGERARRACRGRGPLRHRLGS